jgi:shikimate kinase
LLFAEEAIQLRFAVDAGNESERPPARFPRAQGNLYSAIHSADNYAIADFSRGFAYGWFTAAMTRDRGYFRYHFLEALAYVTLIVRSLTPIHAACVGLRGAGLVLCGQSGAGKTSLAYACARKGWEYISDDACHLVRKSEDARLVVGRPHHIRFRESARTLFAELATHEPCERANGKMDIELPAAVAGIEHVRSHIQAAGIVFLNRDGASRAKLRPFSKERAREVLNQSVCVGEEPVRQAQRDSIDRFLLQVPALELSYSRLEDAEHSLRSFLEEPCR